MCHQDIDTPILKLIHFKEIFNIRKYRKIVALKIINFQKILKVTDKIINSVTYFFT